MEVQVQNLRRHMHFLALLSPPTPPVSGDRTVEADLPTYTTVHDNVWQFIKDKLEGFRAGNHVQLGHHLHTDRWVQSSQNTSHPGLMGAIKFFAENHLHLSNVVSARVGKGLKELPPIKGLTGAIVVLWRPD